MERESMCGGAGDERELNPYSGDRVTWEKKILTIINALKIIAVTLHSHSTFDSLVIKLIAIVPIIQVLLPLGLGCVFYFSAVPTSTCLAGSFLSFKTGS